MIHTLKTVEVTQGWGIQILLLSWAAGSLDALGYLGLGHVFTANMTGNTVLLGLAVGQGQMLAALHSISALLGFVLGVSSGVVLVKRQKPATDVRRAVTYALVAEGVVLAVFTVLWHLPGSLPGAERTDTVMQLLIVLAAVAMGIQSAVVRRLNFPGIATTYLTGTITSLVAGLVNRVTRAHALSSSTRIAGQATIRDRRVQLQAGVFFAYGVAAVASGVFQTRVPALVALSPLVAIVLVLVSSKLYARREEVAQE
jgi:uncharacterized membrane protein YoaK (UPF0700 family)